MALSHRLELDVYGANNEIWSINYLFMERVLLDYLKQYTSSVYIPENSQDFNCVLVDTQLCIQILVCFWNTRKHHIYIGMARHRQSVWISVWSTVWCTVWAWKLISATPGTFTESLRAEQLLKLTISVIKRQVIIINPKQPEEMPPIWRSASHLKISSLIKSILTKSTHSHNLAHVMVSQ